MDDAPRAAAAPHKLREGTLVDCVSSPDNVTRTALRIMVLALFRGFSRDTPSFRKALEAQQAARELYEVSFFLNQNYKPDQREAALRRMVDALAPLALVHDRDPFHFYLLATGEIVRRGRKKIVTVRPLRP